MSIGAGALAEAIPAKADESAGRPLSIAEAARRFGVTPRSLRFYESRGFLSPRRAGAARSYSQADCDRLVLILTAKRLGFTLREIGELIAAPAGQAGVLDLSRRQCTEQINLLERRKRDIEFALVELRRLYSSHYLRELDCGADKRR